MSSRSPKGISAGRAVGVARRIDADLLPPGHHLRDEQAVGDVPLVLRGVRVVHLHPRLVPVEDGAAVARQPRHGSSIAGMTGVGPQTNGRSPRACGLSVRSQTRLMPGRHRVIRRHRAGEGRDEEGEEEQDDHRPS